MKKILFAMAAFFSCTVMCFAQISFIATLQHEGEFTHYYGATALQSAYDAAVDGDTITLSSGTFTSPGTIDKGITLRGAGVEAAEKTFVSQGTTYFYSREKTKVTTVEGIKFLDSVDIINDTSGEGSEQGTIKFIKNTFISVSAPNYGATGKGPAIRFYNSSISYVSFQDPNTDFLFYNCYVENPVANFDGATTTAFVNCVFGKLSGNYYGDYYLHHLNFYNCIFANIEWNYYLPQTPTFYNCLFIGGPSTFAEQVEKIVSGGNNYIAATTEEVFKTYRDGQNEGETFELTTTAKETYKGTDGTEIGMQGGNYPYTTTVQYPIITKFISEPETNKAGILNIEVEVDGK